MLLAMLLFAAGEPIAKRVPEATTIHGKVRMDDYGWLRKNAMPEVQAYLRAENAYTDLSMRGTQPLRETLYREALGRLDDADTTNLFRDHGYEYFTRTERGLAYPVYGRERDGKKEVLLDLNVLGRGLPFIALGAMAPSVDGNLIAYSVDLTGGLDFTLRIRDARSGKDLPDRIERVTSFAWATDNRTLFYVVDDATKRSFRLYRHVVGVVNDTLVQEERDERFHLTVYRTSSDAYIVMDARSFTSSESSVVRADRPGEAPRLLAERLMNQTYEVGHRGDAFILRTNDRGPNRRLVSAPVDQPARANWRELVPMREDVVLEDFDVLDRFYVLFERRDVAQHVTLVDFTSGKRFAATFPEAVYHLQPMPNLDFHALTYRVTYSSFTTPPTTWQLGRDSSVAVKARRVHFDSSAYVTERLFALASDGTRIPISLVRARTTGKGAPLVLTGYGAYGVSLPVSFDAARLSLLDRGVVIALAHVRGGGEYGERWHHAGRMLNKKNSFSDFIACAEHLIGAGYTSADRLGIAGHSAGGLLVAGVLNMRPELFKAAVALSPFVDVVNTMLDESLPLTVGEFEEWGNPKEKAAYDYMMAYSPYDNVAQKAYPATLVRAAYNDAQVMYFEPAKWVAKLRAKHAPVLLSMDMEPSGHAGASDRYAKLKEEAFVNAFLLSRLGLKH